MSSVLCNVLGNAILADYLVGRPNWLALHTENPGVTGDPATEVAGEDYARQRASWSAPGSKTVATTTASTWAGMPAATVAYIAVWDALSGGHCWVAIQVSPPIAVAASGHFLAAAGDLAVTL